MQSIPPQPGVRRTLLSADLENLRLQAGERALSLGELEAALHGRGFAVIILLCALPFALPIPIPGLSVPFGLVISLLGFRLMIGRKPWLPKRLLERKISPGVLLKMLAGGVRLSKFVEKFSRERLPQISHWRLMQNLTGLAIFVEGIALSLPPPMINAIPAWALLMLTAGMIEKDGLLILAGYVATVFTAGYLVFLGFMGFAGFEKLQMIF